MRKFFFFFFASLLFFFSIHSIQAQNNTTTPTPTPDSNTKVVGWRATCLAVQKCSGGKDAKGNPVDPGCVIKARHRVKLALPTSLTPNSQIYIAECISYRNDDGPFKYKCTTGSDELDKKVFCDSANPDSSKCAQFNFYSQMHSDINYSIDPYGDGLKQMPHEDQDTDRFPNPADYGIYIYADNNEPPPLYKGPIALTTTNAGKIPNTEWGSFTSKAHDRRFIVIQLITQTVTPTPTSTNTTPADNSSSINLGTMDFNPVLNQTPTESCDSVSYDPEGTVFDALSLEPIPNATLTLMKQYTSGFQDASQTEFGIVNPFITDRSGIFSFIVSNGTYKFNVSAPNYTYPLTDISKINPIYSTVYSQLYPIQNGENIVESGAVEHRDIPLYPSNNIGYSYPLQVLSYFEDLDKKTGDLLISGKVSHPLTDISVYSLQFASTSSILRNRLIQSATADAVGAFTLRIPQNLLQNEYLGQLEFSKSKKLNYGDIKVILNIQPIANYVEGTAYDDHGNIIPKAVVSVMSVISGRPYFQTQADLNGYFKIPSDFLPTSSYFLQFTDTKGNATTSTLSQFLTINKNYLQNKTINPYLFTPSAQYKPPVVSPIADPSGAQTTTSSSASPVKNYIFVILIILLIFVTIPLIFYIRRIRSNSIQPPKPDIES